VEATNLKIALLWWRLSW